MQKTLAVMALAGALLLAGAGGALAAMMNQTVHLKAPAGAMKMTMHAMGTAKVSYTTHDATIQLTTDGLPAPASIHEGAYVLWLVNGAHKVNAGSLHVNGMMAGAHIMTMDTAFNKMVVTAEKQANVMHAMGPRVLVGTVMHH